MEPYNTSGSPPSGLRQSRPFGHEDRDEIKRRAVTDFLKLYADHGGRCRGKSIHCIFHDDRTPSASIRKGRFHCFTCNLSLDVIEFVQRAQATDFKGALSYLSNRYGVPLQSWRLPPADRAQYAREQRDFERDLPAARRWQRAALLVADSRLDELKAPLSDPKCGPTDYEEIFRVEQDLTRLRRLEPSALVKEYSACRERDPQVTSALVQRIARLEHTEKLALEAYWDAMDSGTK
jgi:hypothetical protein